MCKVQFSCPCVIKFPCHKELDHRVPWQWCFALMFTIFIQLLVKLLHQLKKQQQKIVFVKYFVLGEVIAGHMVVQTDIIWKLLTHMHYMHTKHKHEIKSNVKVCRVTDRQTHLKSYAQDNSVKRHATSPVILRTARN